MIASVKPVEAVSFNMSMYKVAVLTSRPDPISVAEPANAGCLSLNEEPEVGLVTTGVGASTSIVTVSFTFVPVVAVVAELLSVKSWY